MLRRTFTLSIVCVMLALTALPALAQDVEVAAPPSYNGLGIWMVLIGLASAAFVGFSLARRESTGNEDDLI